MTLETASFVLCVIAIAYAIVSAGLIRSSNKFMEKMKQEDLEAEKRHREILERMDQRTVELRRQHEETIKYLGRLITTKGEELKELIRQ